MNSSTRQQSTYRKREIAQVRQAVTTACQQTGYKPNLSISALDDDANCLLVVINTPDDVRLRNAITEAMGGYDLTWCEEYTSLNQLSFIVEIGYWRISLSLDEIQQERPRLSLISWLRVVLNRPSPQTPSDKDPFPAMEEGYD